MARKIMRLYSLAGSVYVFTTLVDFDVRWGV